MPGENINLINVGPQGTFAPSGEFDSTPATIDTLFTRLKDEHCQHMVVYFHGGLVSEKSAEQTARDLNLLFREIGAEPVFFIWETGIKEVFRDKVYKFLNTKIVKDLKIFILGQVAKRWGVKVEAKGADESLTFEEIEAELAKDRPFEAWDRADMAEGDAKGDLGSFDEESLDLVQSEMEIELAFQMQVRSEELEDALVEAANDPQLVEPIRQAGAEADAKGIDLLVLVRLAAKIGIRVLRRRMNGSDHGLHPTVVEEVLREVSLDRVGKFAWDSMKSKASEMWLPEPPVQSTDFERAHVGAYFLDRLIEYTQATPGFTVDLVGHSAGSIVICELLRAASKHKPPLKFGRIALLAPAVRLDIFYKELVSHPERFEQLRVYAMSDELEMQDAIAGKLYPLSLVFFVSGVLEDPAGTPISGLARCISGASPYDVGDPLEVHTYLHASGENRLVLSITGADAIPGLRSNSRRHGDFDNIKIGDDQVGETMESIKIFLQRKAT